MRTHWTNWNLSQNEEKMDGQVDPQKKEVIGIREEMNGKGHLESNFCE